MVQYSRIVLAERPKAGIEEKHFRKETATLPDVSSLKPNEVIVQVQHLSLDPAMRGWLNDTRSYIKPVAIGETMRAGGLGTVIGVGSSVKSLKRGDVVEGTLGWTEYAIVQEQHLTKRVAPRGASITDYLGVLGMPGQTAYWGILDVGKIKKGDNVLVSGAAGAVGSVVCQIAKLYGCKVTGLAGGPDKCKWLEQELGIKAIDYKADNFVAEVKKQGYFNVYFDNVGPPTLSLVLTRLAPHARLVICGAIAQYNSAKPLPLDGYLNIISQRAVVQGFIVFDYAERYREAEEQMAKWIAEGNLKRKETVAYGLDSCVKGLQGLYQGANTGKMIVTLEKPTKAHL